MVQTPLLFDELDTLNLSGLGIGDEGAGGMAKTLGLNPSLRRCVLSDNKIGEVGGAALAAALAVNTSLQVGVGVLGVWSCLCWACGVVCLCCWCC